LKLLGLDFGKPCNARRIIEAEGDRHTGYGIYE